MMCRLWGGARTWRASPAAAQVFLALHPWDQPLPVPLVPDNVDAQPLAPSDFRCEEGFGLHCPTCIWAAYQDNFAKHSSSLGTRRTVYASACQVCQVHILPSPVSTVHGRWGWAALMLKYNVI